MTRDRSEWCNHPLVGQQHPARKHEKMRIFVVQEDCRVEIQVVFLLLRSGEHNYMNLTRKKLKMTTIF